MKNKLNQILFLSGLYFIISSFFGLISNYISSLFAILFPLFIIFLVILTFFKLMEWVIRIKEKFPDITLLLSILGAYTIVHFIINLLGALIEYLKKNEQGGVLYSIYEEWNELVIAAADIVFFAIFMITLFITLMKKIIKKNA